jgi:two-component system sensor histidine kinase PilS (NtrC family)
LYLGRLTLVTGILVGMLLEWSDVRSEDTLLVTVMFLVALTVTAGSFWHTHVSGREPGENFLYGQVILDVLLVTAIVHVTGGPESNFAPVYILVISSGALLLPLPGGVLIGALASMVYLADLVWGYEGAFRLDVALQLALFTVVALITGLLGDRLRRAGLALGAVQSELRQLRLDTGDILANLSTGVLTVDGEGRLAYANPAAASLLGLSVAEWMGRRVVEEVNRLAPGMGDILEYAIRDGRVAVRSRVTVSSGGRDRHLGITTAVLERGGDVSPSATALFQDVTDVERIEALHRRAERLEAVAELSASLAHEIKNPLASIRSAVEQLTGPTLAADDRKTLVRLVVAESDRLSRLLSAFLDYSGLKLALREEVRLSEVVRDCVVLVRQHPEAENVEIECVGLDQDVRVAGDGDLLHRAAFNLILNAVQFSGEGGRVRVTVENVTQRPNPRGTRIPRPVCLRIRDSGPGIDPEVLARIFDPFFTTREGGSGLGLAVVYRAVEAHEGAVFVDRAPDGGTEFVIYLPGMDSFAGGEQP